MLKLDITWGIGTAKKGWTSAGAETTVMLHRLGEGGDRRRRTIDKKINIDVDTRTERKHRATESVAPNLQIPVLLPPNLASTGSISPAIQDLLADRPDWCPKGHH
jgi:hypothetical protein